MLWLDDGKNVGLRLRVVERKVREQERMPLVFQSGETKEDERATSFECVFEEFCVRTGYLVGRFEGVVERESEVVCVG